MSETKHSEGPFTFEEDRDVSQGRFDIRDAEGNYIGQVVNDYADYALAMAYWQSDDCPMEADARLFAASWDMLSVIIDLMDTGLLKLVVEMDEAGTLDPAEDGRARELYERTVAAISKATGGGV